MDKCTLQVLEWHITHLNVQAVIMIWICQSRCIAKILYAKSGINKVPYAKIPIDKIPYAESALCRNSIAQMPYSLAYMIHFLMKFWLSIWECESLRFEKKGRAMK